MISIIHPSRSRPRRSYETCRKWIKNSGIKDIELLVSLDIDDPLFDDYMKYCSELEEICSVKYCFKNNKSAIEAINVAAQMSTRNILVVASDDTDCPENWAVDLLKFVEGKKDWILKTQDGIQPWLITMPIMDRTYYNRFGYIYHPDYQHCFCDTELTCVADLTGRKIVTTLEFTHNHYSIGKAEKDEVSEKADATFESGKKIFIERKRRMFDLPEKDIHGQLVDNVYTIMR